MAQDFTWYNKQGFKPPCSTLASAASKNEFGSDSGILPSEFIVVCCSMLIFIVKNTQTTTSNSVSVSILIKRVESVYHQSLPFPQSRHLLKLSIKVHEGTQYQSPFESQVSSEGRQLDLRFYQANVIWSSGTVDGQSSINEDHPFQSQPHYMLPWFIFNASENQKNLTKSNFLVSSENLHLPNYE